MANWNGGSSSPHPYQPVYAPAPGPTAPYAEQYAPQPSYGQPQYGYGQNPSGEGGYNGDQKNPYEGDRFKPKKRINDPAFLILFIAQVCLQLRLSCACEFMTSSLVGWVHNYHSDYCLEVCELGWTRRRRRDRTYWHGSHLELVRLHSLEMCLTVLMNGRQPHCDPPSIRNRGSVVTLHRLPDPHSCIHQGYHAHYPDIVNPTQHVRATQYLNRSIPNVVSFAVGSVCTTGLRSTTVSS